MNHIKDDITHTMQLACKDQSRGFMIDQLGQRKYTLSIGLGFGNHCCMKNEKRTPQGYYYSQYVELAILDRDGNFLDCGTETLVPYFPANKLVYIIMALQCDDLETALQLLTNLSEKEPRFVDMN